MTSFVHVDQPTSHPGVERAEVLFAQLKAARAGANGSRPLIVLLIVAALAAAAVVADNLVTRWDEGALLAAWAVLCIAVFAGVALFAGSLRDIVAGTWNAAAHRRAAARADARFLETAKNDPRIMQELQAATWRHESEGKVPAAAAAKVDALARMAESAREARMPTLYDAMRRMNSSRYY